MTHNELKSFLANAKRKLSRLSFANRSYAILTDERSHSFFCIVVFLTIFTVNLFSTPSCFSDEPTSAFWYDDSSRATGALKTLIVNGVEYRFRWIPGGSFMMGSNEYANEKPIHNVRLTHGFWLQDSEVTQRQWESIMGDNPSWFSKNGEGSNKVKGLSTDNFPVENVSFNDITGSNGFLSRINNKVSGVKLRLPSEAEWEYACRTWRSDKYSGSSNLDEVAWHIGNSNGRTHKVGVKESNKWGLYDMSGNVCEWCGDWYSADYYKAGTMTDPRGPKRGSVRVCRGGGWRDVAGNCRNADRYFKGPDSRSYDLGFRLVCQSTFDLLEQIDETTELPPR